MVERVLAVVGEEKIFETIVVVVADANSLSPTGARQAGFAGDVSECAVAIVLEQIADRFFARGETLKAPAIHQKDIQPAVVIEVVKSGAASGGLQQIFVLVHSAENDLGVQARFARHIDELHVQSRFFFGWRSGLGSGRPEP